MIQAFDELNLDVSRKTISSLEHYVELLVRWNKTINLVAKSSISEIWTRHIIDSAQLFSLAPKNNKLWGDFGSGAGLPGLVVATIAQEKNPGQKMVCVESDKRKAAFLNTVIRELSLNAEVASERIENMVDLGCNVISARALAGLDSLLLYADRHLAVGGTCLFLKGARYKDEIEEAKKNWSFSFDVITSITDPGAAVLKIGEIERVG